MTPTTSTIPISRLRNVQISSEAVWGTSVACTARLMGVQPYASLKPYVASTVFDVDYANLAPSNMNAIVYRGGEFTLNMHASFEDLLYVLNSLNGSPTITPGSTVAITSSTDATPIEITTTLAHGMVTGDYTYIASHLVNVAANGKWKIHKTAIDKFTLDNSIGSGAGAGSAGTAGKAPFTQLFAAPLTATNSVQTYTIEGGYEASKTIKLKGCVFNKFTLKGEGKKQWEVTINGFCQDYTMNATLTAGLPTHVVNVALFGGTVLSIDAASAAPGTTPFNNTLVGVNLEVDTGIKPEWTGDNVFPSVFTQDQAKVTLTPKLFFTNDVATFMQANWEVAKRGVIRLLTTNGTNILKIDFAGIMNDNPEYWPNFNGSMIVEPKLIGQPDDGTLANYLKITDTCSVMIVD